MTRGPPGGGSFVRRGKSLNNSTIRLTNRANTLQSQTSAATQNSRPRSKSVTALGAYSAFKQAYKIKKGRCANTLLSCDLLSAAEF